MPSPPGNRNARKPSTAVIRAGILAALEQGEATVREIEARMGVVSPVKTIVHLRNLERCGRVLLVRRERNPNNRGGMPITVWALPKQKGRARA